MIDSQIEPLMKPEQVARLLNVKPNTVYVMARRGQLKCVRFGKKSVRFRREDVEELIRQPTAATKKK